MSDKIFVMAEKKSCYIQFVYVLHSSLDVIILFFYKITFHITNTGSSDSRVNIYAHSLFLKVYLSENIFLFMYQIHMK